MKFKTIAMTGMMSLAGLGLVGAGAHAVFTATTTSSQNITSGNLSVVLSSPAATAGDGTTTLTLGAYGPTASSFTTGDDTITMTNNGTIPANEITETMATNYPSSQLAADLYVCEVSYGPGLTPDYVIYNGPLVSALFTQDINGTIAVSGTDEYTTNIYAGSEPTLCGDNFTAGPLKTGGPGTVVTADATSPAPDLTNVDMSQSLNVTVTVGYSG
jgi:predicted ribosomally synthesized peptide with SipW-like signal peptide